MDVEETLHGSGMRAVVTFGTVSEGEEWLAKNSCDLAIVDPRLRDGFCRSVVKTLVERGIPFVVYTGDDVGTLDAEPAFASGKCSRNPACRKS